MLVSSLMRSSAISQINNAQFSMMQNNMNMMSTLRNLPSFSGNMETLHAMDNQFAMNQEANYSKMLFASVMKQNAEQMQKQNKDKYKISYIA